MKKCPYCAEKIQDNAVKCRYCGEFLPNHSYLYPINKKESNALVYVFFIKGEKIKVEYKKGEGKTLILKENKEIANIPKSNFKQGTEIKIANHKIKVWYKEYPHILNLLLWNSGVGIAVDGKPVETSIGDPKTKITFASFGIFLLAIMGIGNIFMYPDFVSKIFISFLVLFFLILGFLVKKIPILASILALLFAIPDFLTFVIQSFQSNYVNDYVAGFAFWFLLRGGICLALIQGVLAGFKLRTLKRKFYKI